MRLYEEAAAAWEAEATKPLLDRHLFRVSEVSCWLARRWGQLGYDPNEARLIVDDIFEYFQRGEFDPDDVLVGIAEPPYFVPSHVFIETAEGPE